MDINKSDRLTTIDHHIAREESMHPTATGEFTSLLHDLALAIRIISREVRRAGINDILGLTSTSNIHGEKQQKLDQYANDIIKKAMSQGGHVCAFASEEDDEVTVVGKDKKSKYIILFDPLDGSSNISINATIGTIFGVYRRIDLSPGQTCSISDVLQPGYKLITAGYALYGSSTLFVYSTGNGVHAFTYDPTIGEFLLNKQYIRVPKQGSWYSFNEGNYYLIDEKVRKYLEYIKTPSDDKTRPFTLRYIGTLIADLHRLLHYGGVYLYPATIKNPQGKLRLIYEVNPLAFILEQAGGRAIDGERRILEIVPEDIHQRTPLFMGSPDDMDMLESFLKQK